jgi:hypothetical protein
MKYPFCVLNKYLIKVVYFLFGQKYRTILAYIYYLNLISDKQKRRIHLKEPDCED